MGIRRLVTLDISSLGHAARWLGLGAHFVSEVHQGHEPPFSPCPRRVGQLCGLQQVVGYLGYSGRDADVVVTAAFDPEPTFATGGLIRLTLEAMA